MFELNLHKKLIKHLLIDPTKQGLEKAITEGYVLGPNIKTMFTIKALKGYRVVNDMVKQIAVEYSNRDIQYGDKNILKYGEAQD